MAISCASICFGIFLTISSVLHLGEVILNGVFVYTLYYNKELRTWFVPCIGLLLLPMVTVQLVSAVMLLLKKADTLSACSSACTAVLHILQLGFLWRHIVLFREKNHVARSNDLADLNVLQVLHTFTSMLPLLLIQTFLLIHRDLNDWVIISAIVVTLVGSAWSLASFRRNNKDHREAIVLTWPGTVFRFLWRLGEIVSRVISLTVFASVYYYWIFLILGLHGLTMLVCLCTSVLGMFERPGTSRSYKLLVGVVLAYMYSFCFINLSSSSTTFRYILFYVIMFFENVVLTAVWYLSNRQSDNRDEDDTIIFISAIAFFIAIVSMAVYYKFFHISASMDFEKQHICETDGCINCKLSLCSKHNLKLQRPFSAGWISQYQQALASGNYYKNVLQDPLLDSEWGGSVPELLNSSGEHWQIRDSELDSIKTNEKPQFTSLHASGTYAHKRFFNSDPNLAATADADSIASGSGTYDEDWRTTTPDNLLMRISAHDSYSLVSSKTQLLTDSWDNMQTSQESICQPGKFPKKLDILNSLIRKDLDSSFFSDGYTTDHTLDSYQLPVTVLAKRRTKIAPRKVETAYSTASDCTDCTICAFIKQHPSSPESSRRGVRVHDRIPEDLPYVSHRPRRIRSRASKERTERKKRSKSAHTADSIYDCVHSHHYERKYKTSSTGSNSSGARHKIHVSTSKSNPISTISNTSKTQSLDNHRQKVTTIPLTSKPVTQPHRSAFKAYVTDHREKGESPFPCASDSGDSAFPRHTPLSAYLAAADNDHDGNSESSCEMII